IVGPAPDGIAPAGGLVALGQSVVPAGRGTSHPVVLPYGDPVVVSVDTGPSDRAIVTVFPTDLHIGPPRVVPVGDIVGVAHRTVVPPIGGGVHDTVGNGGPDKVPVEGPVHIMPVVYVDKSGIMAEDRTVVMDVHAPDPTDHPVVVTDVHVPDLGDPAIIIVIDGDVLHLDHRPIIIVLHIGVVVVAGVEGD